MRTTEWKMMMIMLMLLAGYEVLAKKVKCLVKGYNWKKGLGINEDDHRSLVLATELISRNDTRSFPVSCFRKVFNLGSNFKSEKGRFNLVSELRSKRTRFPQ
nr:hypothetical protein [Tanacetum cinerariifolium]